MENDEIKLQDIYDVAIFNHGFTEYFRDYQFEIEANWRGELAGRYILKFKHCYDLTYKTIVKDDIIKESWDDIFTDFDKWEKNGEPEGFVWGTNWCLAYPGFEPIQDSENAKDWSKRLGKKMYEVKLETNSFLIHLIYEQWILEKLNDDNFLISQVTLPLND